MPKPTAPYWDDRAALSMLMRGKFLSANRDDAKRLVEREFMPGMPGGAA